MIYEFLCIVYLIASAIRCGYHGYVEYLTRWGPGLLRLGAIMSFGGYCVSRPGLLRLGAVVG